MPGATTMTLFRTLLAACTVAAAPAVAQPVQLTYAAYFTGLHVADMRANFSLQPQTYKVQLSFQVTGAASAFMSGGGSSRVDGRFAGDTAQPRELFSSSQMRGKVRTTQIGWQDGRPTVAKMEPPLEPEREPVPVAQQAQTIDSMSAMAMLLRRVWATGRCESDARTFDGRWLSRIQARTVGEESLEQTSRSSFNGVALRCDIEGQQLAGFVRDADEATLHRPHRASVWFARMAPGGRLVPVRISVDTHGFGEATMYVTAEP